MRVVERRLFVGVVGLREADADDLARRARLPRDQAAFCVDAVVDAVRVLRRAADDSIDPLDGYDPIGVVDRRGALEREERLDRVLELLGVAAVRRVEHAVEDRTQNLRLRREEPAVHTGVEDGVVRVETPRVVRVPPVERRVHRKPLPLLERKANLRREVETREILVVDDASGFGLAQQIHVLGAHREVDGRSEQRPLALGERDARRTTRQS